VLYHRTAMKPSRRKPLTAIRIDPEAMHQARIAAVTDRKTLGQWLEEAIAEKIERDKKGERNEKS